MRGVMLLAIAGCLSAAGFGQTFDVASIKPSLRTVGKDAMTPIMFNAAGLSARNVTLKRLIVHAYGMESHQLVGGPNWLDSSEFDVDAKADAPITRDQLNAMLRALLTERFHLAVHHDTKELHIYELVVDKGGPKIHAVQDGDVAVGGGSARDFRGSLQLFANLLAVQLSIPLMEDPGRPSVASGPPVPVVDRTGLPGVFAFSVDLKPELGVDMFTLWQRELQGKLGLKLESRKSAQVDVLVVDRAVKIPTAN